MKVYQGKTAKAWRHRWQVVRLFHNGALIVVSGHRSQLVASFQAAFRDVVNRDPDPDFHYDIRRTPEVVGRTRAGAGR